MAKQQLVPQAHPALDNMKYEIAAEMGIPVYQGSEDYWGQISSRDCGAVGGSMTRNLIKNAQNLLNGF